MVGSFITPYLKEQHELRVLDLAEPQHDGVDFVKGSVTANSLHLEVEKDMNLDDFENGFRFS